MLIWLYLDDLRQIPRRVRRRIDQEPVGLSPFVQLELDFLHEIGRFRYAAEAAISDLQQSFGLVILDASSAAVCRAAADLTWTRDPFDRLIAAHATVAGIPLLTQDETIRRHLPLAWWSD